jgi:hypothetical protein
MRGWGRVPIYKASKPNHELGIQTNAILLRKEIKEVICGHMRSVRKKIQETNLQKREEHLQLSGF